jgi:integrase
VLDAFGAHRRVDDLRGDGFEALRVSWARKWGPVTIANEIQRTRVLFKYAVDAGLVEKPVRFGPGFQRPSKKTLRKDRQARGLRTFEAKEIRSILEKASAPLRAMILLGISCGFDNHDCATLPRSALDLEGRWVRFPRSKTAIERRCPLWPETVQVLKDAQAVRPEPKDPALDGLVFRTRFGDSWTQGPTVTVGVDKDKPTVKGGDNAVSKETRKLMKKLGINGHRAFYAVRHTFETIAGESRDQPAVDSVMGHARDDMASVYRERISDDRLRAVTECVRRWLFEGI